MLRNISMNIQIQIFHFFLLQKRGSISCRKMRKQLLREMCDGDREAFSEGKHSSEDLSEEELKNLIVDDNHGIIYCYIPKVACTNWKRVMYVLAEGEPYNDPMSIPGDLVHTTNKLVYLSSFPRPEIKAKLKHYTKFLFVRHPFIRLISAYRDKFQKNNEFYYQNFARDILRLYGNQPHPPHSVNDAFAAGIRMSFNNFIQYDFVGHQETLQEDANHLLRLTGLQDDIKFPPSYENMTSHGFMEDFFKEVPLEHRRKLYELYEKDFRLFGYRKPGKLLV
ncbi:hypothetical protein L3Q82_016994 [Scortum barcoo]|uniref:Uncharacterized protein n=1 Tax=Scortum barcoo TaxID=214431 RepID=A0ACB8X917_9TELE|nr:hypothetical protein L3Q82_016994 [Scortum barcoo]